MSDETKRNIIIGLFVTLTGVFIAFLIQRASDRRDAEQPVVPQFRENPEKLSVDVEITNPSTTTYRGHQASFRKTKEIPPLVGAPIEADRIIFTDGDRVGDEWSKSISDIKIPNNDESTIRVYIIEEGRTEYAIYEGTLVIEYRDSTTIKAFRKGSHQVLVVGDMRDIPEP